MLPENSWQINMPKSEAESAHSIVEDESPFSADLYLTPEFEAFATRLRRERRFWQDVESLFRRMLGMSLRNRHGGQKDSDDQNDGKKEEDF